MVGENDSTQSYRVQFQTRTIPILFIVSFARMSVGFIRLSFSTGDLIEIHIFFFFSETKITPYVYRSFLLFKSFTNLNFIKLRTTTLLLSKRKICNAHLHRVTITLKRDHRYFDVRFFLSNIILDEESI